MKTILGVAALSLICAVVAGGSLTPADAPAPTMKTLDEIEARKPISAADIPLVITAPGSYYFAEDINVPADSGVTTAAITIQSGYVTVDLNGFTLRGSNDSNVSGILAEGHMENIVVRNGFITRWEEYAVRLDVDAVILQNLQVAENNGSGISLSAGRITNCVVRNNGLDGITFSPSQVNGVAAGACFVENCEVFNNGESGIVAQRLVTISNTISTRNQGNGILLYSIGSTIKDCTASDNSKCGIILSSSAVSCMIMRNQCTNNEETGIVIGAHGCRVEENHVAKNQLNGLAVNQRSMAFKNTAYDNLGPNFSFIGEAITGPIVTATTSGVVSSDHPWANFSYHTTKIGN